jgi:hypothetical protein
MSNQTNLVSTLTAAATQLAELEKVNAEVWSNLEFRKSIRVILENAGVIVEALQATDWMDIESAPRDGSDFLALVPFAKKHHIVVGCFCKAGYFVSWPGRWTYDPTHWLPLPAAPVAREGE